MGATNVYHKHMFIALSQSYQLYQMTYVKRHKFGEQASRTECKAKRSSFKINFCSKLSRTGVLNLFQAGPQLGCARLLVVGRSAGVGWITVRVVRAGLQSRTHPPPPPEPPLLLAPPPRAAMLDPYEQTTSFRLSNSTHLSFRPSSFCDWISNPRKLLQEEPVIATRLSGSSKFRARKAAWVYPG